MSWKDNKETWISPEKAIKNAINSLDRVEIKKPPNSISKMIDGTPSPPFFVRRLLKKSAYFLVPWKYNEKVAFIIQINARNGQFEGITFFNKRRKSLIISSESALDCAKKAYPKESFVNKGLVWKPCRESTTPISPFHLFESENLRVFVGMNCKTYRFLTRLGKGN